MRIFGEIRPLLDLSVATFSIAQLRYVSWQKVFAAAPPPAPNRATEALQKAVSAIDAIRPHINNNDSSIEDNKDLPSSSDKNVEDDDEKSTDDSVQKRRTLEILQSLRDGTADVRDEQQLLLELSEAAATTSNEELQSAVRTLLLPRTTTDLLDSFDLYQTDKHFQSFLKRIGGEDFHREVIQSAGNTGTTSLVACNDYRVDTGPQGTELVYMIFRDDSNKRIVVTFRGSITLTDWVHDMRVDMHEMDNPFYTTKQQDQQQQHPSIVRIHRGFHSYLLASNNNSSHDVQQQQSKFDQVLFKVKEQLKEYPDYEVYATGHSLGGAASTLFAFMYCAEARRNNDDNNDKVDSNDKPLITVVSFGSPLVGDSNFSLAFGLLQQQQNRLLRNLRVTNEDDIVPSIPVTSIPVTPLERVYKYKHVAGIHILVKKPLLSMLRRMKPVCCILIDYPMKEDDDDDGEAENPFLQKDLSAERVVEDLSAPIRKTPLNHMLHQYHERLNDIQDDLPDRSLDELCQDY